MKGFADPSQLDQANAISAAFPGAIGRIPITIPPPRLRLEEPPDIPHVTESRVERILVKLNPSKVSGPDQIRNWFLKEFSDLVAFPFTEILNAFVNEQRLPTMRKAADVTPLPKKKQVQILEKDLRPISLATAVSKVAEGFIVDDYVKPLVLKKLDHSPYGVIPNSTSTLALISILQHWSLGTDGNGSTIRTL